MFLTNYRSLFGRSLCSVRLFQSPDGYRGPFHRHFTAQKNNAVPQKPGQLYFFRCSFLIFTRSLPAFGRAYASTIPLHSVSFLRLLFAPFHSATSALIHCTAFQPYYVCRPPTFQRLLLRTAIGVGAAYLISTSHNKSFHLNFSSLIKSHSVALP